MYLSATWIGSNFKDETAVLKSGGTELCVYSSLESIPLITKFRRFFHKMWHVHDMTHRPGYKSIEIGIRNRPKVPHINFFSYRDGSKFVRNFFSEKWDQKFFHQFCFSPYIFWKSFSSCWEIYNRNVIINYWYKIIVRGIIYKFKKKIVWRIVRNFVKYNLIGRSLFFFASDVFRKIRPRRQAFLQVNFSTRFWIVPIISSFQRVLVSRSKMSRILITKLRRLLSLSSSWFFTAV